MSKIFIISGVSGSGKSTLAKELTKHFNTLQLISLDDCKTRIYDEYGFRDLKEKELANYAAKEKFTAELYKAIYKNNDLIIEYPFNKQKWKLFFDNLKDLGCEIYFINCIGHNFFEVWQNRIIRNKEKDRHPGLILDRYIKDKLKGDFIEKKIDIAEKEYTRGDYIWNSEYNTIFFNYSNLSEILSFVGNAIKPRK